MDKAPTYFKEHLWTAELPKELSSSYLTSRDQQLPRVIYPDIRVLTANKGTQNDTFYPEESLRGDPEKNTGLISFNRPYAIPILRDHLDTPGPQGTHSSEVYGRVYHPAQIHSNTGDKFLRCMATITHPEAIEAILTGRWLTVSLGSKTDSVRCSICKGELTEGLCDHQKGKMYEVDDKPDYKEKCRWVIGPIRAREISFVVSPSDDQAGILNPNLKESALSAQEMSIVIPRLLVGDDKGIFDLKTGVQVAESELFARPSTGKFFGGLSLLGSPSAVIVKESQSEKNEKVQPTEPLSEQEAQKWMKEDFIGPGKYLLSGWDHDHTVVLDQRGDGTSSPGQMPQTQSMSPGYMYPTNSAEAGAGGGPARGRGMGDGDNTRPDPAPVQDGDQEDHTHEVLGGRVMKAGYPIHSHDMEPAHAALETSNMSDTKVDEAADGASTILDDDKPVTLGDLYHLPADHPDFDKLDDAEESQKEAKLTYAARKNLDSGAFCGPDRSFPAHDAAHVRNGLARLSQSSLSSEQKASVHGCLSGRAKKYGIKVGGKEMFAAKLVDTHHRIEIGLYRMPETFEDTESLIAQVKTKPHTPAEKESILSRVAAHCKDILPMSSWQFLFGELSSCEAGDPVEIVVNAENYGLLYSLSTPASNLELTTKEEEKKETEEVKEEEKKEESDTTDKVEEVEKTTEDGIPIIPLTKAMDTVKTTEVDMADPATDIVKETIKNLRGQTEAYKNQASLALAHSVALYMKSLRKPFSRGKTSQELIEALSKRSTDSLQDTLNDLLQEIETGGTQHQPIPKLEDPTLALKTEVVSSVETSKEVAETDKVEETPKARLSPLVELPDEDEETFTLLGTLYSDLKVVAKK